MAKYEIGKMENGKKDFNFKTKYGKGYGTINFTDDGKLDNVYFHYTENENNTEYIFTKCEGEVRESLSHSEILNIFYTPLEESNIDYFSEEKLIELLKEDDKEISDTMIEWYQIYSEEDENLRAELNYYLERYDEDNE